ncbi:ABC transporter permease [candidate division KSB3 bacterium]|uniref:ABC transporter permease n=1 Tax=candidate division KSB3 bacterium TaxID=2044937 RepID=A0A2G6KKN7_9BACT|nr:MAG: ABC transporter permease [candidate division KSB3 bacterium]
MLTYILRRIVAMVPLLFLVSIITFIIIQLPPGDFFDSLMAEMAESGSQQDSATMEKLREHYGLDKPMYMQYLRWVGGWFHGDFGWSLEWSTPVLNLVAGKMVYTLVLGFFSLLFMVAVALPFGVYSATHQYSISDHVMSTISFLGLCLPGFLLALLWMFFGAIVLRIDVGGVISSEMKDAPMGLAKLWDYFNHLWPPAIILGFASTAQLHRIMRGSVLDVLGQQYITTARAKGLKERKVINKYVVRIAINPLISVMALEIPKIISASALVGIVLSVPTLGPLFLRSLLSQDMYLAGTILLCMTMMLMVANLVADILLAWADPRIRYS